MTTDTFVHGNPKVLVVDDEETARENLQGLLESSGFAPAVAADGQEALERAAEQDFAIVLMDIKMPRMSGMEALPKLHKQRPDTIIIMTTGVGDAEMAMEAVRLGAYDYLVKPLDFDTVITRIKNALMQRELRLQRTLSSASGFKKTVALRIAYLFMLGCAGYAPIELARLIVWHHDTYDQLTLVPIFGLELAVLTWGILGVVLAVAHAWLWIFGLTGRRRPLSLVELPLPPQG